MSPEKQELDDKDHPLRNEEEIDRILRRGSPHELEALRQFYGLTTEAMQHCRHYALLDMAVKTGIAEGIRTRELFGPGPSEEEVSFGDYLEALEVEVRDAVRLLRKKGYAVARAGFDGRQGDVSIQVSTPQFVESPELAAWIAEYEQQGVHIRLLANEIRFGFDDDESLAGIRYVVLRTVQHIPDLGRPAAPNETAYAQRFRRDHYQDGACLSSQANIDEILVRAEQEAVALVAKLTTEQRDGLTAIAKLPLSTETRRSIALVAAGLKPATLFGMRELSALNKKMIRSVLSSVGLLAVTQRLQGLGSVCLVAKDQAIIEQLMHTRPDQHHEAFGRLMGFPETAVQAFVHGQVLRLGPREISRVVDIPMRLSRSHWPQELAQVARWSCFLQEVLPGLRSDDEAGL